ncbi:hypothetical protein [Leptodesmis sp.]|uniref:hypothetical protein n=1 Tax=Leptodesmis sp. TaxID=3100501 RepID=UPI0040534F37
MKRLPWVSLVLLLVCYAGFGSYLAGLATQPAWMKSACEWVFSPDLYQSAKPREVKPSNSPTSSKSEITMGEPGLPESAKPRESLVTPSSAAEQKVSICSIIVQHNVHIGLLAIGWILVSSLAFISPLTSFSSFVSRWFKSNTVAFLTIVTIAGMAAVILHWLHVFLQILTILAADTLARIDIQTAGLTGNQAFWILTLVSLTGLITGWLLNVFLI